MIKIQGLGNYKTVPKIVKDIIEGNLPALEKHLKQGWNINDDIKIDKYTSESPLDYALHTNCFESVKWLVEHGANLNDKESPSFLQAVRYCDEKTMLYLVEKGANIHAVSRVGTDAFKEALYGKKHHHLPVIERLGHTAKEYGGQAFRSAVSDCDRLAIEFFVNHGVNVNYNKPDMVYSYQSTPLCVAAQNADLEMCKYLVALGADVTIADNYGCRPYIIALEINNTELAEYFKSLEPAKFHCLQNKLLELKPYKLPETLLRFLQGDNLRLDFDSRDTFDCAYIDFFTLTDTIPMKAGRKKLLRLSKDIDNYGGGLCIVWNHKTKRIASYDVEHEILYDMASFDEFMKDAAGYMKKMLGGEIPS